MAEVIGVRFKNVGKIYYFDPIGLTFESGQKVIVETARGVECGQVVLANREVSDETVVSPLKPVMRLATERDLAVIEENRQKEKEAFTASRNISFLRTVTAFLPSFFFLFPDRIVVDRFIECFFPALMIIRTVAEKPHGFSCDCLRGHIV